MQVTSCIGVSQKGCSKIKTLCCENPAETERINAKVNLIPVNGIFCNNLKDIDGDLIKINEPGLKNLYTIR